MSARLLVVDADEDLRTSVQRILRRAGYVVDAAGSAAGALGRLRAASYDVAIVDAELPDTDGAALARQSRDLQPDLEVLLLAPPDRRRADEGAAAGAYDVLPRPFRRAELERAVARAIDHRTLASENRRLRRQLEAAVGGRSATAALAETPTGIPRPASCRAGLPAADEPQQAAADGASISVRVGTPLEEVERVLIRETLRRTGGNKQRAASLLGIAARTIYRKLEQ